MGGAPPGGFTLIEVLVALALVGTIATIVYGSFAASFRAVDLYRHRLACRAQTSLVLRLMARQIRCAYQPPAADAPPPGPSSTPIRGGDPAFPPPLELRGQPQMAVPPGTLAAPPVAFRAEAHPSGGTALSFLTTAGSGAGPEQPTPLARVSYRHDPAPGTLSLVWEPYVPGAAAAPEPAPGPAILRGVQRLDVQLYDGRTWQSRWDGASGATVPQAVRIALTVVDDRQRVHEFKTQVAVAGRRTPPRPPSGAAGERP